MIDLNEEANRGKDFAPVYSRPSVVGIALGLLRKVTNGREVWAIADQALVSGTNFLTNVIVARSLGLTEFGVFALAWMAVLFFFSLQISSIVAPMMSLGPKSSAPHRPQYYGSVLIQELCFLGICCVILSFGLHLVSAWSHQPALNGLIYPLLGAMVAYLLQDFLRRYFFTIRQSFRAFMIDLVSYLPQLPLIFVFIRIRHIHTSGVLWLIALTSLIGIALGLYWFESVTFTRAAIRTTFERHWAISRWLAPSAVLWWTSTNFFVLLAPLYFGAMAAGVLRASQNLMAVCNIWFLGLENVIPAEASRLLKEEGPSFSSHYLRRITLRWGLITLVFVSILSIAPNVWLHVFYGPKYAGYGYLLRLYGISYVFVFTGLPLRAGLQAAEHTSPIFWTYLLMTAITLTIAAPITRILGLRGVILGTILIQILFQTVLLVCLMKRFRRIAPMNI